MNEDPNLPEGCVPVKIRAMHGNFSTMGLHLADASDKLCPPLLPGQVVPLPGDHPLWEAEGSMHVEVCPRDFVTRPLRFSDESEAIASGFNTPEERNRALQAAVTVQSSLEMSRHLRAANKAHRDQLIAAGQYVPEVTAPLQGPRPINNNAVTAESLADAEVVASSLDPSAQAGVKGSQRGKKTRK